MKLVEILCVEFDLVKNGVEGLYQQHCALFLFSNFNGLSCLVKLTIKLDALNKNT